MIATIKALIDETRAVRLRKWYFALNEAGLSACLPMVKVAVRSCQATTDLEPHCLYVGAPRQELDDLAEMGVRIIPHESSVVEHLRAGYGKDYPKFAGHWLRVDIPVLERSETYILYTDIDVIFRGLPARLPAPMYFAAAPEHNMEDWSYFNSGIMLMNLPNMRKRYDEFRTSIIERLSADFKYPTHDQSSFNSFYADLFDHLPLTMNWKPYWGENDAADIVHFHGPKRGYIATLKRTEDFDKLNRGLVAIWRRDEAAYDSYCALYDRYLEGEPEQRSRKDVCKICLPPEPEHDTRRPVLVV